MKTKSFLLIVLFMNLWTIQAQTFQFDSLPNGSFTGIAEHRGSVWFSFDGNGGIVEFSPDQGTFSIRTKGMNRKTITSLCTVNHTLVATHKFEGVFRFDDVLNQWINITPRAVQKDSNFFVSEAHEDTLMVGGANGYLFWTNNLGKSWHKIDVPGTCDVSSLRFIGTSWLLGSTNNRMFRINRSLDRIYPVHVSNAPKGLYEFQDIDILGDTLLTMNRGDGLYYSYNDGITWQRCLLMDTLAFAWDIQLRNHTVQLYVPTIGSFEVPRLSNDRWYPVKPVYLLESKKVRYQNKIQSYDVIITFQPTTIYLDKRTSHPSAKP